MPPKKTLTRKQKTCLFSALIFSAIFFLLCYIFTNDSRMFHALADEMFHSELSSNALSLHYTLAYPEKYGFTGEATLSSYDSGSDNGKEAVESALLRLSKISPRRLSKDDAFTYHLLERYLKLRLRGISYAYYDDPLSPSSGMQSGLPILLADYTFRSPKDVEDYLHILDQTDTYFEGLIQYEKEKEKQGLFMSDHAAQKVKEQCCAIMDKELLSSGTHFLHTTFNERISVMEENGQITQEQKEQWISENDRLLTTVVGPAYESVADAFTILEGNDEAMGLCNFKEGRAYYEYLLASITGSSRSISEIKTMLLEDFQQNYSALAALLKSCPELVFVDSESAQSFPYSTAAEMLSDLQRRMSADFPSFPQLEEGFTPSCTIKSVSPSMENYSSPAYYLTPPIDDMSSNIIYINQKNMPDALTLYTTLAHEGYPGHLYQTVYSQLYMNQNNASHLRYLLHYGGYTEGWALYVENLSYMYAQQLVEATDSLEAMWYEACRLNRNLQLCTYSLLDIAIHYEGASLSQTADILQKLGITDQNTIAYIYEYIVEEPVNYLKYYLGFLEFLSLKDTAEKLWGEEFSLKRFHQFILETGPSDFQGLNDRLSNY